MRSADTVARAHRIQTTHLFWQPEGGKGAGVRATAGVDQGCPLSPALFAIGIAECLSNIDTRLHALSPLARVFSYLDDVIVAVPSEHAEQASVIVCEELQKVGLQLDPSKTAAWTKDPAAPVPATFADARTPTFKCLGATAAWLDTEDDPLARLPVHHLCDGDAVVSEAARFRARLAQVRAGGLGDQVAFQLLQTYSAGCVTHLLRANYEHGAWVQRLDDVWVGVGEDLAGEVLDDTRRKQLFLRLSDGGFGLTSAKATAPLAFLASWALTLPVVAATVGVVSWSTFTQRCGSVGDSIRASEAELARLGGGKLTPPDWVSCMSDPRAKLQGSWAHALKRANRQALLDELPEDDRVDFRSCGGPGAGGYLEPPVIREDEKPVTMPNTHFHIAFRDRLRLSVCPPGSTCQRRNREGIVCGKPLGPRGKHAKLCEFGPARCGRHDSLRDFAAGYHQRATGLVACKEQRVLAWDRRDAVTGLMEEARLDFATRDAITGLPIFVDTTVTCAFSGYAPCQRARANKDGLAAVKAVNAKRLRYPPDRGDMIPMAWEDGGRPAEETVAYVRTWGYGLPPGERTEIIRYGWQQLSTLLQIGNAEMILSAKGQ